jgi:predicted S18 family serine protease
MQQKTRRFRAKASLLVGLLPILVILGIGTATPDAFARGHLQYREQLVPILGVTLDEKPTGTVANLVVSFEQRHDHQGLAVYFNVEPGRFSRMAQTAIQQAIYRTARIAGLSTDSWTVALRVPYPGLTVYGESLSAMIGLSVVALAKGEFIPPDRVITGTVTPDGHIAPVGAVALKVAAANEAHMRRVVVPDEVDVADGDWVTPFLVQVSPVGSVLEAYQALTDHPLRP